jgi:hypothetical protein
MLKRVGSEDEGRLAVRAAKLRTLVVKSEETVLTSGIPASNTEASLRVVGRLGENDASSFILRNESCWRRRHNGHRFCVGRWVTGDTVCALLENGASGAVVSALASSTS